MATLLFNNIDDLKQYVGGGANVNLELSSISAAMHSALRNHILPWLGQAQWAALLADYTPNAADITGMDDSLEALLPYVRRPLALLTMYEYGQVGGIMVSESGFHRSETDTRKTAFKYQENAYKRWHLDDGYEAIEEMLNFLEDNEGDYALWAADDAYVANKSLVINTATELRKHYSKYLSRYTFETLRPLIEDVEVFAIKPLLGDDQYDEVKDWIMMKATGLDAKELQLLKLIRRAVANFTIEEGLKRLWVKIEGKNVVEAEGLEPQTYEKYSSAAGTAMNSIQRHLQEHANIHIQNIKQFLTDNASDFPLYEAYLEALAEAAAAEEDTDTCDTDNPRTCVSQNYYDDFNLNLPSRNSTGKGITIF